MKAKPPSRSPALLAELAAVGLPPDAPQLGPYFLGEILSTSGDALVYLAVDLRIGRVAQIKRLRPEAARVPASRERLESEAKALGSIAAHGVVHLYHAELDGPEPYIVMEWIEGRTLRDFFRRFRPLAPHAAMIVLCDLARTLLGVHELGVVHGGLEPSRVIVHRESVGRLVVSGFDRALILEDPAGETPLAPQGTWAGPFGYAAPEQLLGRPVGVRADQFALGVLAYELCTGHRPFEGRTVEAQLELIQAQRYRQVHRVEPRTPGPLAEAIERSLRFDPGERWPDMGVIAKALASGLHQDLLDDATVEARELFAKPEEYLGQLDGRVATALAQKTLVLANQGETAQALAECRRLILWQPRHAPTQELLAKLEAAVAGEAKEPEAKEEAKAPDAEAGPAADTEAKPAAEPSGDESAPQGMSRVPLALGGVAAGVLAIVALVMAWQLRPAKPTAKGQGGSALAEVLGEPLEVRPFSGRLQEPTLASHLPVRSDEGSGGDRRLQGKPLQIDEEALGRLEKKGEFHAVAIGTLLKDKPGSAAEALAYFDKIDPPGEEGTAGILRLRLAPSRNPDIDSERAVAYLQLKNPAEAFRRTSSALLAQSEHPGARWNQALALQDLGAKQSAIEAFGRIQASGEPGWSVEAGTRRAALQAEVDQERRVFEEVKTKGRAMVAGGPVVAEFLIESVPGHVQLYFYDAVRTSTSAARVMELLPLAEALDRRNGGEVLERYVRRIAGRFSARRAQLAGVYAQLVANPDSLKGEALKDYLRQLRVAGEDDMLIGAMVLTQLVNEHLIEFQRLARAMADPWFELIAENEAANAEISRGEYPRAEGRLLTALKTCAEKGLEFRCARLEVSVIRLYFSLLALPQAEMHATAGLTLARKTGDYTAEATFLGNLGEIAFYRDDFVLGRAYLDETSLREPERCERQRFVHENRAVGYLIDLLFEEARREILAAPSCGQPRSLTASNVMTRLDRVHLPVTPWTQLREEMAALRRQGKLSPGELAVLEHIEGALVMQYDREEGRRLLLQSIAMAQRLPKWDTDALKVLFHSYEELNLDEAKSGKPKEALAWFAEHQGLPSPSVCALEALVSGERTLVVSLDAQGVARQRYEPRRASPDIDVPHLVPEEFKAALRGCGHVDVFASPLLHKSLYLLPPDIEWSLRWGPVLPESAKNKSYHLMIVRAPEPPSSLGLKARHPWDSEVVASPTVTILEGGRATPFNVLMGAKKATEIMLDAPCLTAHGEEYLALSPGADNRYALSGSMLLQNPLTHGPVIALLDRCGNGTAPYRHEPLSLAMSLRQAWRSPVLTVVRPIPEVEGRQFLGKVLARTHTQRLAAALRDERMIWLKEKNQAWVNHIILTE